MDIESLARIFGAHATGIDLAQLLSGGVADEIGCPLRCQKWHMSENLLRASRRPRATAMWDNETTTHYIIHTSASCAA